MFSRMVLILIWVAFLLITTNLAWARIPLIATGWDSPNTSQFKQGLSIFERWGVFDGTTLRATRHLSDGSEQQAINAFSQEQWKWSEFMSALADLQAVHPVICRENYLMLYSNPGDVDWFDDNGWQAITDHWRFLARLAKQGGLQGLLFDAEPYTQPYSQYLYRAQSGYEKHTFAEYAAKARERGRQVMRAVCEEFPDITIFCYRLFSDMLGLLDQGDLNQTLEQDTYGLLPAFVEGWLEVMPPAMRVIEGTEDIGYRANSPAEYTNAFTRLKLRMPDFVAPQFREKIQRQFFIGHSFYLDAYVNPPDSPWYIDSTGSTPATRLAANLTSALTASDGLIWVYGEKGRWWPTGNPDYPVWPERLPGIVTAIQRVKDPETFTKAVLHRTPVPRNLLENGDFSLRANTPDGPPSGWFEWQDDASHGHVTGTPGEVEMYSILNGCVGCSTTVQPGHTYAVHVQMKTAGHGLASLNIGWKTTDGKWTAHTEDRRFLGNEQSGADGWQEIVGLVQVPSGVGQLMFMLSVTGQTSEADRCWFKDAALVDAEE